MAGTNTVTSWVAIYAATVATATFFWNVILARRDVGKVSVSADLGVKSAHTITYYPLAMAVQASLDKDGCLLRIRVTNTGRRPITLQSWKVTGVEVSRPARGFSTLPTLAESQSWEITTEDLGDFRYSTTNVFVTDTHGRSWPLPKEQLTCLRDAMLRNRL